MAQKDPCSNDEVATVGGEGGDEIEEGRKVETKIVGTNEAQQMTLHATTTRPSPVGLTDWEPVRKIDSNYQKIIREKIPALFPKGRNDPPNSVVSTHLRITGPS